MIVFFIGVVAGMITFKMGEYAAERRSASGG